jgi:hypothetical protein
MSKVKIAAFAFSFTRFSVSKAHRPILKYGAFPNRQTPPLPDDEFTHEERVEPSPSIRREFSITSSNTPQQFDIPTLFRPHYVVARTRRLPI